MTGSEVIKKLKQYNKSLNMLTCSSFEREYIQTVNNIPDYVFFYHIPIKDRQMPETVEAFLRENHDFSGLLKEHHEKLCFYLRHIQEYTCNTRLVRMNIRSMNFSFYADRVIEAITGFYLFYALELDMKEVVYGQCRHLPVYVELAPVIATEIMQGNQDVIQWCKDVMTSENNTAVITRNVIKAVEQADDADLHKLLLDLFVAAQLQEGLRQSVIETIDENRIEPFLSVIDVVKEQNLLRFSSVQRGIMTWVGIGYDNVEEKQIKFIFECIASYLHDEVSREAALESDNPLQVYLALYSIGVFDGDKAEKKAIELLSHAKKHIVAAVLVYLKLTNRFSPEQHLFLAESEDEWVRALYFSECLRISIEGRKVKKDVVETLYYAMCDFMQGMKAEEKYTCKGFEWFSVTLSKNGFIFTLYRLLSVTRNQKMVDLLLPYVSSLFDAGVKEFMEKYYRLASSKKQKEFLNKEIISANQTLSDYVSKEYLKLKLSEAEIIQLEGRLKTKKAYARANIIKVLAKQDKELVRRSFERLSASKTKMIYESALELKRMVPAYFEESKEPEVVIKGKKEGFSLYEPRKSYAIPYSSHLITIKKGLLIKKDQVDISFLYVLSKQEVLDYVKLWNQRIKEHALEEYEVWGNQHQIGEQYFFPLNYGTDTLDALPLGEVWREYFKEDNMSVDAVFQLAYHTYNTGIHYEAFLPPELGFFSLKENETKKIQYYSHYQIILRHYLKEVDCSTFSKKAAMYLEIMNRYARVSQYVGREMFNDKVLYSIANLDDFSFMIEQLQLMELSDEDFSAYFPVLYESYEKFHLGCKEEAMNKLDIPLLALARAVNLKLLPKEALYEALLDNHTKAVSGRHFYCGSRRHRLSEGYSEAYFHDRGSYGKPDFSLEEKNKEAYICLREALDEIAKVLLPMEAARINDVTDVTYCVQGLEVINGMKYLIMALHILEGEEIKRQTNGNDRNAVFSDVIRSCYPLPEDSPEQLKREGFSEKRLVEVAMMAPQWMDMVQGVLQWNGFKDACYYFIAHMKQYDYEQKKAEISRYTDIEPMDLSDGAFDMGWCQGVYKALGEKRFSMVYSAAKFLCENSFHTRARKYADACIGKQVKEVFLAQAKEKRNKDALNAYCICPITDDKDLLERYLYVQQFLKESKAFGSQRQVSEKRACEIALMNLARNSRFETVTRLSWMMETEVVQQYGVFLEPQQVEDVEAWIRIDEQGKNEICIRKNGKMLKSIPDKLKKHGKILEIKEVHTALTNQYRRSRNMLETAMEERLVLGKEELDAISRNPVVSPMIEKLLIRNNGHLGFYKDGMLYCLNGDYGLDEPHLVNDINKLYKVHEVNGDIYIAHPYDLHESGEWKTYQKYVFDMKMVQPFKQIFRELYLKLEDELQQTFTKRYTGYQIQPQKAAGALKSRRWNASYENGLERVYHKENLVVCLYADADWFSPSDIEAPSIDYVAFFNCKDREEKKISDIDPVAYSEIMRDVDMAVSTAYVGGVDPITSFSTMELRAAIIEYTCELMKLENVSVQGHFANVEGKHNNYHIHLGSGMIHQDGGSAIHMIPVYSGKRGKVYLPFLDEDPMSAQILTKVLMLAEDTKIKDPAILEQIMTIKSM